MSPPTADTASFNRAGVGYQEPLVKRPHLEAVHLNLERWCRKELAGSRPQPRRRVNRMSFHSDTKAFSEKG